MLQRLLHFLECEPLGDLQFGIILEPNGLVLRACDLGNGADHQVRRVRPGLSRVDQDAGQDNTALLPDFPPHGILDALRGFNESRERREPVRRPALLAAKQETFAVVAEHGHDDRRVGAGERQVRDGRARRAWFALVRGLGFVGGRADSFASGMNRKGFVPARPAVCVTVVPVQVMPALGVLGGYR